MSKESYQPSPDEIKDTEKERFQTEKQFVLGGANYLSFDGKLEITPEQIEGAKKEMEEKLAIINENKIKGLDEKEKEYFDINLEYLKEHEKVPKENANIHGNINILYSKRLKPMFEEFKKSSNTERAEEILKLAEWKFEKMKSMKD